MFNLVFMKFGQLKCLHRENKKFVVRKNYVFSKFKSFSFLWGKNSFQNIILNLWLTSSDWNLGKVYIHSWDNIVPIFSICSRFSDYMLDMFVHNTQMLLKCVIMYEMLKKLLLFIHILPFYVQRYFIAAVDVLTPVCGWAVL